MTSCSTAAGSARLADRRTAPSDGRAAQPDLRGDHHHRRRRGHQVARRPQAPANIAVDALVDLRASALTTHGSSARRRITHRDELAPAAVRLLSPERHLPAGARRDRCALIGVACSTARVAPWVPPTPSFSPAEPASMFGHDPTPVVFRCGLALPQHTPSTLPAPRTVSVLPDAYPGNWSAPPHGM